jgi:hypothetical protein
MAIPKGMPKNKAIEIQEKLTNAPKLGEAKVVKKRHSQETLVSVRFDVPLTMKNRIKRASEDLRRFQRDIVIEALDGWMSKNGF